MAKKEGKKSKKKKESMIKKVDTKPMSVSLWEPWSVMKSIEEEFEEFRKYMERSLISPFWRSPLIRLQDIEFPETKMPLMDIKDAEKELIIETEMPGIPKENIDIRLTENSIEICGERKEEEKDEKEGYYRQERRYSRCIRRTPLPAEVIPEKAEATLQDGILKITIPKKKPSPKVKEHKIEVK